MQWTESVTVALEAIWANKLRSLLTMLGIIIGISAVIAVVAIGQGGQAVLMREMEKIGSNLFMVYVPWDSDQPRTVNDITMTDVDAVLSLAPAVKALAPSSYNTSDIKSGKNNARVQVQGTTADYSSIRNVQLVEGRFFLESDVKAGRRVVVIDEKLAETLFDRNSALGERVFVHNQPATVIGVIKADDSFLTGGPSRIRTVYIPISFWQSMFNNSWIQYLEGQAVSRESVDSAIDQTVKILERRHSTSEKYVSASLDQQMESANQITGIMTLIIGAVAGISLFVGGIGVMNIMLVSVTERTREIGIRKALGAKRRDILIQFLIEAVTICLVGGMIGMLLGIGGAWGIAVLAKWPPLVSPGTMLIAFIFSTIIGIFFGIYPANKAAKMDPIEALRYE